MAKQTEGPLSREEEIDARRRNGGQNGIDLRLVIERGGARWFSNELLGIKDSRDTENSELLELNILRGINDSEIWNMRELGTELR